MPAPPRATQSAVAGGSYGSRVEIELRHRPSWRGVVVAEANFVQLLYFFFAQGLRLAEHVGDEGDLGEVLDGFHVHEGGLEGRTEGDDAMVRHKNRVVIGDERLECVREFGGARSTVTRQRDRAEADDNFAHQRTVQAKTRSGKSGGCGWVGMNDATHLGTQAINKKMHAELAGDMALAGDAFTLHVDDDEVGGGHATFADTGRSYQEVPVIEAHGEVAIGGCNEAARVQ